MLWLLIFTALILKACQSQITWSGNTTANYGGQAQYKCEFANPSGVAQVTWQRLFKNNSIANLATSSNRFGPQVNDPYLKKVIFTETSLSSTSITLVNVTWGDESCYICHFNVYPDGSQRRQTCLTVQGISEVKTSAQVLNRDPEKEEEEIVFSCSATGKPTPAIQWDISPGGSTQTSEATVMNSDHTITSSNNITVKVPLDWRGHVDCVLNKGMIGERRERIPFSLHAEDGTNHQMGRGLSQSQTAFIILAVMSALCIAVAAVIRHKRIKSKRGRCTRTEV